jgi:hypothetical protein
MIFSGNLTSVYGDPGDEASEPTVPRPPERDSDPVLRTALEEITDWLAENPTVKGQAGAFANQVGEQVVEVLTQYGYEADRPGLAISHFLCELLAEFARAIDEFKRQLDKVPDRVISLILDRRSTTLFSDIAIRALVGTIWRLISELSVFGQIKALLHVVRVAAITICPAPDKHEAVVRYCVYPLAGEAASAATFRLLKEVLPPSWVS